MEITNRVNILRSGESITLETLANVLELNYSFVLTCIKKDNIQLDYTENHEWRGGSGGSVNICVVTYYVDGSNIVTVLNCIQKHIKEIFDNFYSNLTSLNSREEENDGI